MHGDAYWIILCVQFVEQATKSQSGQDDAEERGRNFKTQLLHRMKILRDQPFKFGQLSVRTLLDTREQFLNAFGFYDPYLQVGYKLKLRV